MRSTTAAITDEFRADLGESLRMVGQYDQDGLNVQYMREDVERRRSDEELAHLHEELLRENRDGAALEGRFSSGRLRSAMLAFEEFVAYHFISTDDEGYVVTVEPDTSMDVPRFMRKFETVSQVMPKLGDIEFRHAAAKPRCPRCDSARTIATPEAGPESPYYCLDCDRSFN